MILLNVINLIGLINNLFRRALLCSFCSITPVFKYSVYCTKKLRKRMNAIMVNLFQWVDMNFYISHCLVSTWNGVGFSGFYFKITERFLQIDIWVVATIKITTKSRCIVQNIYYIEIFFLDLMAMDFNIFYSRFCFN